MLRFCIDLVQSLADRGRSPTALLVLADRYDGLEPLTLTAGHAALPRLLSRTRRQSRRQIALQSAFRVHCGSRAPAATSRIGIVRAKLPATPGQGFMHSLARQVQPSSHQPLPPEIRCLKVQPVVIPPVQTNATMPGRRRVGSFVTTTIGTSQPDDNPFQPDGAKRGAQSGSIHTLFQSPAGPPAGVPSSTMRPAGQHRSTPPGVSTSSPLCKSRIASVKASGSAGT